MDPMCFPGFGSLWERCKTMDLQPGRFQNVLFIELGFWFGKGWVEIHSFRCLTEARIISDMYVIIT